MSETNNNEAADFIADDNQAASEAGAAPTPPAKAKKQTPQAGVDKFWRSFTTKYPGKVTSILPADVYAKAKARSSPNGLVYGQSVGRSYEQAVAECKLAVTKIAKECRGINAKYRDSHFDIEFDLKRDWRDCLDSLQPPSDEDKYFPRSVKRVTDIFEKPVFFEDDATASDIRQGFNGDCWFLSALCAISNKKHLIDTVCVARDEAVGVYGFVFYRDGEWFQTIIDDKLYLIASDWWESTDEEKRTIGVVQREDAEAHYLKLNQKGSKALYFAQCRSENETWLPLLEKAYAKAHGDYSAIDGGFTGEAIEDLTGGVTTELFTTDILDKDKFWKNEILKVNHEFLFGCSTGSFDNWQDSDIADQPGARGGIIRLHAYSIMDAVEIKGKRLVKVRNPWAIDEWRGPWSDGSEQWTAEWLELLNHKFGDDGIFWISYEDLLQKYSNFDRTRIFGKKWQIVQQWTTLDVPWTADYNDTKFSVTLTKRSPVVIVLSQLDSRYFKGLTGEYFFELHFRVSKDGEDETIVRSHGNYSMRRSVSVDIELDAGTYSVLMRIIALRDDRRITPDDVIKENIRDRQNKLIQVGLAYDLAHAKGEIKETEAEKQERKTGERQKKAEDKQKKRAEFRKQKLREFDRKKREQAREKRQTKRKEEYRRKKAEKQSTLADDTKDSPTQDPTENNNNNSNNPVINGIETAAAPAANNAKSDNQQADASDSSQPNMPTPPPDPPTTTTTTTIKENSPAPNPNPGGAPPSTNESTQTPPLTEAALKQIPSVTLNGAPAPTSSKPAAPPSTAAPTDAASATGAAAANENTPDDDDGMYDSDASFVTSIDSVLDLDLSPSSDDDDDDDDNNDGDKNKKVDNDDDEEEADNEFAADPWNAVVVVGLRVYSKDKECSVAVVRPKKEGPGLDVDDVSKGVSGEGVGDAVKDGGGEKTEVTTKL